MKKALVLGFAVLLSTFAQADYYVKWVVDETRSYFPEEFSYALLFQTDQAFAEVFGSSAALESYNPATGKAEGYPSIWERGDGFQFADVQDDFNPAYSFFAAAYNENGELLSFSDNEIPGADIGLYRMNDTTGGVPEFSKEPMSFTFGAPEPTSALLVLFGLGALALKRKA